QPRQGGLTSREAKRRLVAYGPNELRRRGGRRWPQQLGRQMTHPLALLLWLASALAFVAGLHVVGVAILAVIVLNALFAFFQEQEAERAVEALRGYLPQQPAVRRDGRRRLVDAREPARGRRRRRPVVADRGVAAGRARRGSGGSGQIGPRGARRGLQRHELRRRRRERA